MNLSVADPYHFDTDPDPGKNYTDQDPAKEALVPGKSSKSV